MSCEKCGGAEAVVTVEAPGREPFRANLCQRCVQAWERYRDQLRQASAPPWSNIRWTVSFS